MPYIMELYVRGGCRRNGSHGFIGAAVCVQTQKNGHAVAVWQRRLPSDPQPTNQRAELTAIIVALEQALEKSANMNNIPLMHVKVFNDSKYAMNCMTEWKARWQNNGFTDPRGNLITNRDLMRLAYDLLQDLENLHGRVEFVWIPRAPNQKADAEIKELLDKIEEETFTDQGLDII